jgi:hypothetical protein
MAGPFYDTGASFYLSCNKIDYDTMRMLFDGFIKIKIKIKQSLTHDGLAGQHAMPPALSELQAFWLQSSDGRYLYEHNTISSEPLMLCC